MISIRIQLVFATLEFLAITSFREGITIDLKNIQVFS